MNTQTSKNRTEKQVAGDVAMDAAEIDRRNAEAHKALAFSLVELIARNPRIEWEIVKNYCQRENKYLASGKEHEKVTVQSA